MKVTIDARDAEIRRSIRKGSYKIMLEVNGKVSDDDSVNQISSNPNWMRIRSTAGLFSYLWRVTGDDIFLV